MGKLSHILNTDTLRIIHFAHSDTLIKYGIIFWGTSTTMHKVFFIQKRKIRIMKGTGPRTSCRNWVEKLDILTVPSLYFFTDGVCC